MPVVRTIKMTMLAAASAAALGVGAAHAAGPAGTPIIAAPVEISALFDTSAPVVHADDADKASGNKFFLLAAGAGVLAALIRLIGVKRLIRGIADAGPVVAKAARAAAAAPVKVAKAIGKAAMSPLKFALLFGGLGLFAFTGIGLFGLDWTAGIGVGMALSGLAAYGVMKTRNAFASKPAQSNGPQ